MIRAIVAAVVGYVGMVCVVMLGIAATWFSLGNEFAFAGETVYASQGWTIASLVGGAVAAVFGGRLATLVSRKKPVLATKILIGLVIVLGAITIAMNLTTDVPELPEGTKIADLDFLEAGQYARSPMWYHFAIVIVGVIGVSCGGKLKEA